jgi:hypothetical protein
MKEIKPAEPYETDVADGVQREWYKVGRKIFGIDAEGDLLDGEGFIMSGIDDGGFVSGFVHDHDAYRVAESIRRFHSVNAEIMSGCARLVAHQKMH